MSFLRKVENKVESDTLKECECVTLKYSYCDRCRKVYVHDRGEDMGTEQKQIDADAVDTEAIEYQPKEIVDKIKKE